MNRVSITENAINDAVKRFLEGHGWKNVTALKGREKGVDVSGVSQDDRRRVEVESKGGTSGDPKSKRFGMPFDSSQVDVHVAEAVYKAIRYREQGPRNVVLVALPDDEFHRSRIRPVERTLKQLGIGFLAVSDVGVQIVFGTATP